MEHYKIIKNSDRKYVIYDEQHNIVARLTKDTILCNKKYGLARIVSPK